MMEKKYLSLIKKLVKNMEQLMKDNKKITLNDFGFYLLMGILGFSVLFLVGYLIFSAIFA